VETRGGSGQQHGDPASKKKITGRQGGAAGAAVWVSAAGAPKLDLEATDAAADAVLSDYFFFSSFLKSAGCQLLPNLLQEH
jgi:hypothetical protein